MPLRDFPIGPVGQELYPRFIGELAEKLDDPALDRNVVGSRRAPRALPGPDGRLRVRRRRKRPPARHEDAARVLRSRNATLEAEYYREIDLEKWTPVKPLLWFWQMFDHSPVGRNVRLGTQMRYMLARRVFRKCGKGVRIFHEVEFSFGYNLTVGDGVTIHRNVLIDDRGEVVIGNDASISDYANIYSHSHAMEDIHDVTLARTEIGDRAPHHLPRGRPFRGQGRQGRDRGIDGRGLEAGRTRRDRRRNPGQADRQKSVKP